MQEGQLTPKEKHEFDGIVRDYHKSAIEPNITPIYSALEMALMSGPTETMKFIGRALVHLFTTQK